MYQIFTILTNSYVLDLLIKNIVNYNLLLGFKNTVQNVLYTMIDIFICISITYKHNVHLYIILYNAVIIIIIKYLCLKNKDNQCFYYQYYISKNKDESITDIDFAKTKKYMNNTKDTTVCSTFFC